MYFIYEYGKDTVYFPSKESRHDFCVKHFGVDYSFDLESSGEESSVILDGKHVASAGFTYCP